jgi:hypothetical protein
MGLITRNESRGSRGSHVLMFLGHITNTFSRKENLIQTANNSLLIQQLSMRCLLLCVLEATTVMTLVLLGLPWSQLPGWRVVLERAWYFVWGSGGRRGVTQGLWKGLVEGQMVWSLHHFK